MIYVPIEVRLRMIQEDINELKSMLTTSFPYTYDPIWGRMLYGELSPPEMGPGSILKANIEEE